MGMHNQNAFCYASKGKKRCRDGFNMIKSEPTQRLKINLFKILLFIAIKLLISQFHDDKFFIGTTVTQYFTYTHLKSICIYKDLITDLSKIYYPRTTNTYLIGVKQLEKRVTSFCCLAVP